ncbi:MAG: hypothetical protein WC119_00155 [Synergistaceae bacterium]
MQGTTGCIIRPYKKALLEEFESNETVFMIMLEGSSEDQAKFSSVDLLERQRYLVNGSKFHSDGFLLEGFAIMGNGFHLLRLSKLIGRQ